MDEIRVVPRPRLWPVVVLGVLIAALVLAAGWFFFGDAIVVDTQWLQPETRHLAMVMGGHYGTA